MTALAGEHTVSHVSLRSGGWVVVAGLLALYVPTYFYLYETFWRTGRAVQGPVILAWIAWLLWRDRQALAAPAAQPVISAPAVALSVVGLLWYALGRSQSFFQLEIGS